MGNNLSYAFDEVISDLPILGSLSSLPRGTISKARESSTHENGRNLEKYFVERCELGDLETLKFINFKGDWVPRGLCGAALNNRVTVVEHLLRSHPKVINEPWNNHYPLIEAVRSNKPEVVKLLLDRGANIDVYNDKGDPPLYVARGNLEMIKLLVSRGADINGRTSYMTIASTNGTMGTREISVPLVKEYINNGPNKYLDYFLEQGVICPRVLIWELDSEQKIQRKRKVQDFRARQSEAYIVRLGYLLNKKFTGSEIGYYVCDCFEHDFEDNYVMQLVVGAAT